MSSQGEELSFYTTPQLPVLAFGNPLPQLDIPLPSFATVIPSTSDQDPTALTLQHAAQAVLKAKRIAVVCGAGISTSSGIPDFRSTEGLFEILKRRYPEAKLSSGKDLFDASLFSSEANAAIYYTMIAELKTMADSVQPTAFHCFLKSLDDEGKLHRVYTQNIDGLEERAGLSYGLGDKSTPVQPRRSPTKGLKTPPGSPTKVITTSTPPPRVLVPRVIPLHGHLATLSCSLCSHTISITPHLPLLAQGSSPSCPACFEIDQARIISGVRSRGVGRMKPDVVLYGETHKEGERVGEITRKDLMGPRPDLLLVVGTSLKVPGTKLLVRELAKVIRPAWTWSTESRSRSSGSEDAEGEDDDEEMPVASGSTAISTTSTNASQTTIKGRKKKPEKVSVIYLNFEFPKPAAEWKDVFDVWLKGDVQEFVEVVKQERKNEEERKIKKEADKVEMAKRRAEREKIKAEKALNPIVKIKKEKAPSKIKKEKVLGLKAVGKVKSNAGVGAARPKPKPKPVSNTYFRPEVVINNQKKAVASLQTSIGFPVSKAGLTSGRKKK